MLQGTGGAAAAGGKDAGAEARGEASGCSGGGGTGEKAEPASLYDPRGQRDPFVSFIKVEERKKAGIDTKALPPLQRYDLGELKFVGVIWTKKGASGPCGGR